MNLLAVRSIGQMYLAILDTNNDTRSPLILKSLNFDLLICFYHVCIVRLHMIQFLHLIHVVYRMKTSTRALHGSHAQTNI